MSDQGLRFVSRPGVTPAILRRGAAACVLLMVLLAGRAAAGERAPFQAKAGIDIAQEAALTWAPDAFLVYVENDEDLDVQGSAPRWGYLYFSPRLEKARIYSVRAGKILVAENLEMRLEAPPVGAEWIDSGAALAAAERAAREYCSKHQGRLSTMLLMRGAFDEKEPDQTTWTLVYTSPNAPSLFVVVDASEGKVRRTWRG